ncbi:MAG TPA: ATP-binding cassette domain-containing protein, partial [Marmoricola sp.]|nr:ATP-binding cassette domain-containing protein [Marmoricola sp.]
MTTTTTESAQPAAPGTAPYLDVRDLRVRFATDDGVVNSVDGVSFSIARGRTLGIVGESGSGKSVTSMAIMGLHTATNATIEGSIRIDGEEIVGKPIDAVRKLRGQKMAMIFQDPLSSLHPFYTIGNQIIEAYRIHNKVSKKQARQHAIEMLDRVGIPEPGKRVDSYP